MHKASHKHTHLTFEGDMEIHEHGQHVYSNWGRKSAQAMQCKKLGGSNSGDANVFISGISHTDYHRTSLGTLRHKDKSKKQ